MDGTIPSSMPIGVVTLVFTDLEGSSELAERHRELYVTLCEEHFRLLRVALKATGGYEIETAGDSLFVVFSNATDALRFSLEAQLALMRYEWPPEVGALKVRIGFHTGESFIGNDAKTGRPTYRGPATNRAARVSSAAHGGQVLLSGATQAIIQNSLPPGISLRDCGRHRLKGIGEENLWQVCHADLPSEFPPPIVLNARRHNFPLPPNPLIGREAEIEEWSTLLLQPATRLLTLFGFGGLGKTRCALELAESCMTNFKDGVWWINLEEARSGEDMVAAIAKSIHLAALPDMPLEEQLQQTFSGQNVLLVLDNTEQIPDASRVINDLLQAAPDLKCLVTTRHQLGLRAETVRAVPPLRPEIAIRLFIEYVQQHGTPIDPTDPAIASLCRRLEGVPLALELAASRMGSCGPSEILERLDDQLRLLKSRAPDLPSRQRAMRSVVDWSYEMLSPENRVLFAQLSVFAGGFTIEDVEAIAPQSDAFDDLDELNRVSMLRATIDPQSRCTRYSMLESLRAYAAEKLASTPDRGEEVRNCHARHFMALMESCALQLRTGSESLALATGSLNLANGRLALRHALEHGPAELAARLALALGRVLHRLGLFREAAQCLQSGLDALPGEEMDEPQFAASERASWHACLVLERANAHYDTFEWESAMNGAARALVLYEKIGDVVGQAHSKNLIGLLQSRAGDNSAAQGCFSFALEVFTQRHLLIGMALANQNLGLIANRSGDGGAARRHWEKALEVYNAQKFDRGSAEILNNLGVLAQQAGESAEAWRCYREALDLETKLSHQYGAARALWNLAEIAVLRDENEAAQRLLIASEVLFERSGSPYQKSVAEFRREQKLTLPDSWKSDGFYLAALKDELIGAVVNWAITHNAE
jgi:predicted ATPase/class 3 adenylate cyclase